MKLETMSRFTQLKTLLLAFVLISSWAISNWAISSKAIAAELDLPPSGPAENAAAPTVPKSYISDIDHEYIAVQDLKLRLDYNDVVIPGHNGMDIVIKRVFNIRRAGPIAGFGKLYWHLDSPYLNAARLKSRTDTEDFSCLGHLTGLQGSLDNEPLKSVGYATASQLPEDTVAAFTNRSVLKCEGSPALPVLFLPNGRKLTFGEVVDNSTSTLDSHLYLLSQITDRFGNTISYTYADQDSIFGGKKLSQISRNDGQVVTLNYIKGALTEYVDNISYSGRKITYQYDTNDLLNTHTDAVSQTTEYGYGASASGKIYSIKTPQGLTVKYDYHPSDPDSRNNSNLRSKTITGAGIPSKQFFYYFWQADGAAQKTIVLEYDYDKINGQTLTTEFVVDKTGQRDDWYASGQVALSGTIKSVNTYLGDYVAGHPSQYFTHTKLYSRVTEWGYNKAGTIGCRKRINGSQDNQWTCATPYLKSTKVTVNADTYTTNNTLYNAYGELENLNESNSFSTATRYTKQGYRHDVANWTLNLPTTKSISATNSHYTTVKQITYHDANTADGTYDGLNLPFEDKAFGSWRRRFASYDSFGNVGKIEFNSSPLRHQTFSNYKRGVAQTITAPARYTANTITSSRVVDDNGLITKTTDFDGNIINYNFDKIGRLSAIKPQDSHFLDSWISWSNTSGRPVKTETFCAMPSVGLACNSNTTRLINTTTFDSFGRPTKHRQNDVANNTNIYQKWAYTGHGKLAFSSFAANTSAETGGTSYGYDTLKRHNSTSITGGGSQAITYLSGNQRTVSDFADNETTTTYLAYGQPEYQQPTHVASPQSVTTTLTVNVLGNVTAVTQQGPNKSGASTLSQTQYHAYDANNHLCKVSRNDVGTTVYSRNTLGDITWQAQGVSGGTDTDCASDATAIEKVNYAYDNLGDPQTISYGDSTAAVNYTYSNAGDLTQLIAGNVTQTYGYNSNHQVTAESLSIDGKTFDLGYDYDSLGSLTALKYPNAETLNFTANAFGQPSEASIVNGQTHASAAKYYPNGILNSFTFGNGIKHKTTLNARKIPSNITDASDTVTALNLSYSYDDQANISAITDGVNNSYSLTDLSYDGLNRLTATTGNVGIGSSQINYDGLGNITGYTSKGRQLDYSYDTTKNRLTKVTDAIGNKNYDFTNGYDSRGNVTNNGNRSFNFNRANQLASSNGNSYIYDGHNRRVKTIDSQGTSYSVYGFDGKMRHRVRNGNWVNYIYLGDKLIAKDGIIPLDSGSSDSRQHHRPFGESIEAPKDDVGYTGHKFDTDLGWSYMQQRYMDPALGRFMSNDPIGFRDVHSFNRYVYANNNPYKYTDPDGQAPRVRPFRPTPPPPATGSPTGSGPTQSYPDRSEGDRNSPRTDRQGNPIVHNEAPKPEEKKKENKSPKGKNNKPKSTLPRDSKTADYVPDPNAEGAHTTIGKRKGRNGNYTQGATFDENGNFTGRTDVTDHGRPSNHDSPHFHPATGTNSVGDGQKIEN